MNVTVTSALLSAIAQLYTLQADQRAVLYGLLEGLVLHNGKAYPLLASSDLEKLVEAGILEQRGNRIVLRPPGKSAARFTDSLCATYKAATGQPYLFSSRDGVALAQLQRIASEAEIMRRWQIGLSSTGWLQTATIAQLGLKWNDLAMATGKPTGNEIREGDVF